MESDTALTDVMAASAASVISAPPSHARGTQPELDHAFTALLIMYGCKARWVINYWKITNKYGVETGVSARNDGDEWQSVLSGIADKKVPSKK